jgi:hypothetical protein
MRQVAGNSLDGENANLLTWVRLLLGSTDFMAAYIFNPEKAHSKADRKRERAIKEKVNKEFEPKLKEVLEKKRKTQAELLEIEEEGMPVKKMRVEKPSSDIEEGEIEEPETSGSSQMDVVPVVVPVVTNPPVEKVRAASVAATLGKGFGGFGRKEAPTGALAVDCWLQSHANNVKSESVASAGAGEGTNRRAAVEIIDEAVTGTKVQKRVTFHTDKANPKSESVRCAGWV